MPPPKQFPRAARRSHAKRVSATETPRWQKNRQISAESSIHWAIPPSPALCLAKALNDQWSAFRKHLHACQKEVSEQSVHQLRVATRRLMTRCALLGSVACDRKVVRLRKKLKRQLSSLGQLRDTQVQQIFFEQHTDRFPVLILVRAFLKKRERRLTRSMARKVRQLKSRKLEEWTLNLSRQVAAQADDSAREKQLIADVFAELADAFHNVVSCREEIAPTNVQTVHRTRVAFKRFRYMVEALSPDFTGFAKPQLRRLGNYQRRMGKLQDLEILQECVSDFLKEHPEHQALLASFNRYLATLRRRALKSCLDHADDFLKFWPVATSPSRAKLANRAATA